MPRITLLIFVIGRVRDVLRAGRFGGQSQLHPLG